MAGDSAPVSRHLVIGLGGIGSQLVRALVPFLHAEPEPTTLVLVDGDRFEETNRGRMLFARPGPKAEVLVEELAPLYGDRVALVPVVEFLTARNAPRLIGEGDTVFCAPDNHATRRLAERRCARLRDAALFCGGNEGVEGGRSGTFGSVLVYLRSGGRDLTPPPSRFHPEIPGCGAQLASAPQLLFTNMAVAVAMLGSFHAWREGKLGWEELHLDLHTGRSVPLARPSPLGLAARKAEQRSSQR
jgi:hypothetical protein